MKNNKLSLFSQILYCSEGHILNFSRLSKFFSSNLYIFFLPCSKDKANANPKPKAPYRSGLSSLLVSINNLSDIEALKNSISQKEQPEEVATEE